jgi:hypothetical protein
MVWTSADTEYFLCSIYCLYGIREQEREAVVFAKEVRRANKMLVRLEEESNLQTSKLFAK